jgi:hypothetical protein
MSPSRIHRSESCGSTAEWVVSEATAVMNNWNKLADGTSECEHSHRGAVCATAAWNQFSCGWIYLSELISELLKKCEYNKSFKLVVRGRYRSKTANISRFI